MLSDINSSNKVQDVTALPMGNNFFYTGQVINNQPHGEGTLECSNGTKKAGIWKRSKEFEISYLVLGSEFARKIIYSKGSEYWGPMREIGEELMPDGKGGTMDYPNGYRLNCCWIKGRIGGWGALYDPSRHFFCSGTWESGSGFGVCYMSYKGDGGVVNSCHAHEPTESFRGVSLAP